jgi:serine/threonine-protein kinase
MDQTLGHYKIVSELGRGGMGVVYKAYEESLNRYVAIKVLGEHLGHDENFAKRFVREAKAAAGLSHPNVVQIFFIGHQDGRHYFVMEWVEGRTVQQIIRDEGPFDPSRAAKLVYQAAAGLAAAHDRGLIHRDIKPANLMVTKGDLVKIADFGLAMMADDGATRLTGTGMLMGTPGYLSPEQCNGEPADARSDIYSLGMTFYEMLAGAMPWKGESPLAVLRQVLDEQPPPLSTIRPEISAELAQLVDCMIDKDPTVRFQSCHEVQRALESLPAGPPSIAAAVPAFAPTEVLSDSAGAIPPPPPAAAAVSLGRASLAAAPAAGVASPASRASLAAPRASAVLAPAAPLVPVAPAAAAHALAVPASPPPARRRIAPLVIVFLVVVLAGAAFVGAAIFLGVPMIKARFFDGSTAALESAAAESPEVSAAAGAAASGDGAIAEGAGASSRGEHGGGGVPSSPALPPSAGATERPAPAAGERAESAIVAVDGAAAPEEPGTPLSSGAAAALRGGPTLSQSPSSQTASAVVPPSTRDRTSAEPPAELASRRAAAEPQEEREPPPAPRRSRRPLPQHPRVTVVAYGEPSLAAAAEQALESQLERHGFEIVDEQGLLDLRDIGGSGALPPSELLATLDGEDVQAMVLVEATPVGQRELNALGRYDVATTSRLRVTAFGTGAGRALGRGWNEQAEYTSLNAARQAERVIGGLSGEVAAAITALWEDLLEERGARP